MKVFGTMKKRHVCSALLVLAAALAFAHAQAPAVNPTGGPVVTCTTGVFDCQNGQLMAAFDETGFADAGGCFARFVAAAATKDGGSR